MGDLDTGKALLNHVLHWTGKSWSPVDVPSPGGTDNGTSFLNAVRCASATDCWAVGADGVFGRRLAIENQVLHWNGRKWGKAGVPDPGGTAKGDLNEILGLSCTSAASCWAAGFTEREGTSSRPDTRRNELLRWSGTSWRPVQVPDPDGSGTGAVNVLASVNCSSAADCWAVGDTGGQDGKAGFNEALHWTGTRWFVDNSPTPVMVAP